MSTDPPAHSALSATNDSIVYAAVDDGSLEVIALDPDTGSKRWSHPSDVGSRVAGTGLAIYTDDDSAYFLTRDGAPTASSVAYEASGGTPAGDSGLFLAAMTTATGETRWATPVGEGAKPNARECGPYVCLFVLVDQGQELWSFNKSSGEIIEKANASLPEGPGNDAFVSGSADGDLSTFLVASRGPEFVGQFSNQGNTLDWSKPVTELFPGSSVSPNSGWAGGPSDAGWVVWLGAASAAEPKAGDVVPFGSVAGIGSDGSALWERTNRHACGFALQSVTTICDGDLVVLADDEYSAKPSTMEGIDPATGATTWTLALDGAVDEVDSSSTVLQLDDETYLIAAPQGLTEVNLVRGPTPSDDTDAVGWCDSGSNDRDDINVNGQMISYARGRGAFPCHMGGEQVDDPSLPVPDFAGVQTSGWSVWLVDGTIHAKRNP